MKTIKVFSIIIIILSSNLIAQKSKPQWGWFSAFTVHNEWRIYKGKGTVEIKGDMFLAKLYLNGGFLCYSIKGRIHKDKIIATSIHHGTDDYHRKLIGKYEKTKSADKSIRKSYLLREVDSVGGLVIGITRDE